MTLSSKCSSNKFQAFPMKIVLHNNKNWRQVRLLQLIARVFNFWSPYRLRNVKLWADPDF